MNNYDTPSARKRHSQTSYCTTVTKSKSIENVVTKGPNWLIPFRLFPKNLPKISSKQAASHGKGLSDLNVAGDSNIFSISFRMINKQVLD